MKHYTYHALEEIISYEGFTLLVKAQKDNRPSCSGCFFSKYERQKRGLKNVSCCTHGYKCTASQRKDKKHVIFAVTE